MEIKLFFLFKQFCLQFYGAELWFGDHGSRTAQRQFEIGYHKAIKKLIGLSYRESNHYGCQQAELLIFKHFLNKLKIQFMFRLYFYPCIFIEKIMKHICVSSVLINEVNQFSNDLYQIDDLLDNDRQAVVSRILYVQNHESQMRGPLNVISDE